MLSVIEPQGVSRRWFLQTSTIACCSPAFVPSPRVAQMGIPALLLAARAHREAAYSAANVMSTSHFDPKVMSPAVSAEFRTFASLARLYKILLDGQDVSKRSTGSLVFDVAALLANQSKLPKDFAQESHLLKELEVWKRVLSSVQAIKNKVKDEGNPIISRAEELTVRHLLKSRAESWYGVLDATPVDLPLFLAERKGKLDRKGSSLLREHRPALLAELEAVESYLQTSLKVLGSIGEIKANISRLDGAAGDIFTTLYQDGWASLSKEIKDFFADFGRCYRFDDFCRTQIWYVHSNPEQFLRQAKHLGLEPPLTLQKARAYEGYTQEILKGVKRYFESDPRLLSSPLNILFVKNEGDNLPIIQMIPRNLGEWPLTVSVLHLDRPALYQLLLPLVAEYPAHQKFELEFKNHQVVLQPLRASYSIF